MRSTPLATLFVSLLLSTAALQAEVVQTFFGTTGRTTKGIYRATFDTTTGKFGSPELAAEVGAPGFLAVHPDGKKLYAAARVEAGDGVAGYRIGANGALEVINTALTGDGSGSHISVHPSGKFLVTAQYGNGSIAVFPLDGEGRLGKAQVIKHEGGSRVVSPRQDVPHPHSCFFSPDGKFALVPDLGKDGIVIYRVNDQGPTLTAHGFIASTPGGGARHLKFSTDGKFIHLLNEMTVAVTTYSWDAAAGTAKLLQTTPALSAEAKAGEVANSAAEILVHPSGRFVYSSNRGNDTVTVYSRDPATASLAVVQVQPVRGAHPRNMNLAPGGAWLLAAGQDSNTVSVHKVNPDTGKLTYQTASVINVPTPICIVFAK
jgi:6-phosphogluconolactonase